MISSQLKCILLFIGLFIFIHSQPVAQPLSIIPIVSDGQYTCIAVLPGFSAYRFTITFSRNSFRFTQCNDYNGSINYLANNKISLTINTIRRRTCSNNNRQAQIQTLIRSIDSYLTDSQTTIFYNSRNRSQNIIIYPQVSVTPPVPNSPNGNYVGYCFFASQGLNNYPIKFTINSTSLFFSECNGHSCQASFSSNGNVVISNCFSTKKYCDCSKQSQIVSLLQSINRFTFSQGIFTLSNSRNSDRIILSGAPKLPNGVYNATLQSSQLQNFRLTITVNGNNLSYQECNNPNCPINYSSDGIKIGPCISTLKFCPNSKQSQISNLIVSIDTISIQGTSYLLSSSGIPCNRITLGN